jgi:ornithine cyclodeaminase/alanine dehydrogenase-like protein (mu-crystallin family)
MRVLDAEAIDRALSFDTLIAELVRAFQGGITVPERHHHHIARPGEDATLLLMPAWSTGTSEPSLVGTKIVTVYPANATRGLPSIMGSYLLMDGRSGEPLCVLDGARVTLWRTAAASALAAGKLARKETSRMVMAGAGMLAPFLIRAHASVFPLTDITIWNRSHQAAEALAATLAAEGLPVRASADLEAEVRRADLVSCATLAREPFLRGDWLKAGAHLDLVGAFNLSMREADDVALARAQVWVDTDAACTEGGDVAVAIRAGSYARDAVRGTLFDLCQGPRPAREADAITLFKSVGAAIEDLAAASLVWRRTSES